MYQKVPKVIIFPITYKCNLKCVMCNIWKEKQADIPLVDITKIFKNDLLVNYLESINITGGEPLLRKDINQVIETIIKSCKNLNLITLNTNGVLSNEYTTLIKQVQEIRESVRDFDFSFYISLDGIDEKHDDMRGVSGAFSRVCKTLDHLKLLKNEYSFHFSLNFTITKDNYMLMEQVMDFALSKGLQLDYTFSMVSEMYFSNGDDCIDISQYNTEAIEYIINKLEDYQKKRLLTYSHSYYNNLIHMLKGGKRVIGCIFQNSGFFLHPSGDVFSCWAHNESLGNIYENSIDEIWSGSKLTSWQQELLKKCETCYNNCYVDYNRIDRVRHIFNQNR